MNISEHVVSDHNKLFGKSVIKNTRISVALILEKIADGYSFAELILAYPTINTEDIKACLLYASCSVKNEITYQLAH